MLSFETMIAGGALLAAIVASAAAYFFGRRRAAKDAFAQQTSERIDTIETAQGIDRSVEQMPSAARREELGTWRR